MMDTLDKWIGRVPGRLGLEAVAGGSIFATLSGSSAASVAMLGGTLVKEMEKRGYKKPMSLGPILGSGGLAIMIPPSGLAVLLGAIGEISIGGILISLIIPGLLMGVLYASYIILRSWMNPQLAPAYEVSAVSLGEKIVATVKYILPLGLILFLVIGVIFLGVSTPTEAAASGVIGTLILAALYRKLSLEVLWSAMSGTVRTTGMIFFIIVGAAPFSQILAFSGATPGLIKLSTAIALPPLVIIIMMMIVVIFLGMVMSSSSILMVCLPLFMPIVRSLGFNDVWFAVIMMLNIEMGMTSPPFGMALFVMKGVAPPDTTMGDCYRAALPFLACDLIVMVLLLSFPQIALWLPGLMN
jgi:tripartite ATP-independent transporter DctM subunit